MNIFYKPINICRYLMISFIVCMCGTLVSFVAHTQKQVRENRKLEINYFNESLNEIVHLDLLF